VEALIRSAPAARRHAGKNETDHAALERAVRKGEGDALVEEAR
jgi:hypothetical protein